MKNFKNVKLVLNHDLLAAGPLQDVGLGQDVGGDSVIFSIGCDGQGEEKVGVVLLLGIYLEINSKL